MSLKGACREKIEAQIEEQRARLEGVLFRAWQQSRVDQIQITFADATLNARRRDYESARKGTANLFSLIRAELDRGLGRALPTGATEELKHSSRNATISLPCVARSDPASAARLANAYASFQKALGK